MPLVVDQPFHGGGRRHPGQALHLRRRPAESGALEQVRRLLVVPVLGTDRREVVLPRRRAGAFAGGPAGNGADRQQQYREECLSCHGVPPV